MNSVPSRTNIGSPVLAWFRFSKRKVRTPVFFQLEVIEFGVAVQVPVSLLSEAVP